ncbi:hypothetical protein HDU80_010828 [Chytriomyces hyalinus]|nr:hypothetical protein HDU80_010828 [Chytriomyces hyalinus]
MQAISSTINSNTSLDADILDAVVVGSGYGSSTAAVRFLQSHGSKRVAVLERGREWLPGSFPQTTAEAVEEIGVRLRAREWLNRDGLFDVRIFEDLVTVNGCGLGGGSLINASVMIEPNQLVFKSHRWPLPLKKEFELNQDGHRAFDKYYDRARSALKVSTYPDTYRPLPKLERLRETTITGVTDNWIQFEKTPLAVAFEDTPNDAGFVKPACNLCGNCVTGCNTGAKGALNTTLLATAWKLGAKIYTEVTVVRIEPDPVLEDVWIVVYTSTDDRHETERVIKTHRVFLGAGAMGSTEILLRSKALSLSKMLGKGYSGNGDSIGAAVGVTKPIATFGNPSFKNQDQTPDRSPGPCITSVAKINEARNPAASLTMTKSPSKYVMHKLMDTASTAQTAIDGLVSKALETLHLKPADPTTTLFSTPESRQIADMEDLLSKQLVIEDCSVPFATKALFNSVLQLTNLLETDPKEAMDAMRQWVLDNEVDNDRNDVDHFQTFLVMSHDDSRKSGTMTLDETTGLLDMSWPGWRSQKNYPLGNEKMKEVGDHAGQDYFIPNPVIAQMNRTVSVHSLGGCCMGDSVETGVVNDKGAVYNSATGGVYKGLYVVCGAIVPRSLGINPALTITALAERVMEHVE